MINNLMICINGIVPVFMLILIGVFLKKIKLLDDSFTKKSVNLIFKLVLPVMIFNDISTSEIAENFDGKIVGIATVSIFIMFFISWVIVLFSTKDNKKRAAFSQGAFRANYAILGLPLTKAVFPSENMVNATVILAVSMVIYNVLSIIFLEMFLNSKGGIKSTLTGIIKNPVIISAVLGSIFYICGINLPTVARSTLSYIGQMCVPLSLITIGASMVYEKVKSTMKLAVWGAVVKTIINPLLFTFPAILLGIKGGNLGVLFIFWAAPCAVAGYAMTRNMGGDYDLAGNIIMVSTAMSFFVMFIGLFLLKNAGLV